MYKRREKKKIKIKFKRFVLFLLLFLNLLIFIYMNSLLIEYVLVLKKIIYFTMIYYAVKKIL